MLSDSDSDSEPSVEDQREDIYSRVNRRPTPHKKKHKSQRYTEYRTKPPSITLTDHIKSADTPRSKCKWIQQAHVIEHYTVLIKCFLDVFIQCTYSMYSFSILTRCTYSMYSFSVLNRCTHSVYLLDVLIQCIYSMYSFSILTRCTYSMYSFSVLNRCTHSVYLVSVLT